MTKSNKIQHTKKALIEALEKSLGVVTTACKQVGIDRTTFYRYYKDDKEFKILVDDLSNVAKDFAESQLFKQIQDGNPTATIFYLKTKAKDRGYVERREIEHTGDVKSEIIQWKPAQKKK
tara:strand:+ start:522 stop:881 length:360 start_codon:yes stop_codon:yes gene_type:complete